MNMVFKPLRESHPLVKFEKVCPLCDETFRIGQRVMLIPARQPLHGVETVPSAVAHATCCLRGMKTIVGEIDRIKDGDASPYPVITTDGKQHTLQEAELSE